MKHRYRRTSALVCGLFTLGMMSFAALADSVTYYVDNKLADYTGHDGSSWENAYLRIQDAVNRAANGDTVLVAPGVYGDDQGVVVDAGSSDGSNENYSYQPNRIWINNKHITLKSSEGATKTHIVGRHSPDAASGIGSNAVRCISLSGNANIGGTRIEGFTLREGAALRYGEGWTTNKTTGARVKQCPAAHRGGAVLFNYTPGNTGSFKTWQRIHIVDCVISNCVAPQGAAVYGASLVRCRLTRNSTHMGTGGTVYDGNLANCILHKNGSVANEYTLVQDNSGTATAINCTFYDNKAVALSSSGTPVLLNCFYEANGTVLGDKGVVTNGVGDITLSGIAGCSNCTYLSDRGHQALLVAPIYGDFRPVLNPCYPAMFGVGSKALCEAQAWMEAADRSKDFFGNPRWDAENKVTVGAIQDGFAVGGGCITVTYSRYWIDGEYFDGPMNGYFHSPTNPAIHRIRPVPLANIFVANAWFGGYNSYTMFPDRNGDFFVMAPPKSSNSMRCVAPANVTTNGTAAVWADPTYTGSDSDGSSAKPYRRLQDAVDAASRKSSDRLVLARPGRYDEGGRFLYGNARVCVTNAMCIFAVGGPEKTFIVGADGEGGAADGCGTNAWRCVSMQILNSGECGVIGFTLTGGRTCANDSKCDANLRMGGGLFANRSDNCRLIDCVITNCTAVRASAAYKGWLVNCRVVGNQQTAQRAEDGTQTGRTDRRGVLFYTCVSGSVIGPNSFVFAGIDQYCELWNCTVNETSSSLHISADADCYNVLDLTDNWMTARNNSFLGCAIETSNPSGISITNEYLCLTPPAPIADRTRGDFRPLAGSALLTGGKLPPATENAVSIYMTGGYDKSCFPMGQPVIGACADPVTPVTLTKSRGVEMTGNPYGTAFTSPLYPLTLTATRTSGVFKGFEVNGDVVTTGRVLELPPDGSSDYTVNPLYFSGCSVIFR